MPSKYWIKLYHEILDDPKMGKMPDRLFRRTIELFLLAGEVDEDGFLPGLEDIAWRLRCDVEQLETEMIELENFCILSKIDGRWMVTKFADRQAPVPVAERVARHRERKRKENYYETEPEQTSNEVVTSRYTDIDTDIDKRREEAEEESTPSAAFDEIYPIKILSDASGLSAFPADQLSWIEVITSMARDHGIEKTTDAMKRACDRWTKTKSKNGRVYRKTNLSWINWAQEELAGGEIPRAGPKTREERFEAERRKLLAKHEGRNND